MEAFRYAARDFEGVMGRLEDIAREWRIRDDVGGVWKRFRGLRGLVFLVFLLDSFLHVFFYKVSGTDLGYYYSWRKSKT